MTKTELIDATYEKFQGDVTKKLVSELVDSVFHSVAGAIKKDERFSYPGFGTFVKRQRKPRQGRNPQTGEIIKIKASTSVGFRAARVLKESL